jgi:hypothetical protein
MTTNILSKFSDIQRIVRAIAQEFLDGEIVKQMAVKPFTDQVYATMQTGKVIGQINYGKWLLFFDKVDDVIYFTERSI